MPNFYFISNFKNLFIIYINFESFSFFISSLVIIYDPLNTNGIPKNAVEWITVNNPSLIVIYFQFFNKLKSFHI